jgi:hypothetical protein
MPSELLRSNKDLRKPSFRAEARRGGNLGGAQMHPEGHEMARGAASYSYRKAFRCEPIGEVYWQAAANQNSIMRR